MLGSIYSKKGTRKVGFYELIAQRIAVEADGENPMDRGQRLEPEAIEQYEKKTGNKVEKVGICENDDHPKIINSPDGLVKNGEKYIGAVEAKCLSSARHLQAVIEKEIPSEYDPQKAQYFIVNPDLEWLDFVFYDPRIPSVPLYIIRTMREEIEPQLDMYLEFQLDQLEEIDEIVEQLAF
jgi:hypothetical protein